MINNFELLNKHFLVNKSMLRLKPQIWIKIWVGFSLLWSEGLGFLKCIRNSKSKFDFYKDITFAHYYLQ